MAASISVAAWYGDRRILGWLMIAGSVVAGVDGAVCKWRVGKGEWGHWGYGPVLAGVGVVLLGGRK